MNLSLRPLLTASTLALAACGSCVDGSPRGGQSEGTTARPLKLHVDGGRRLLRLRHGEAGAREDAMDASALPEP